MSVYLWSSTLCPLHDLQLSFKPALNRLLRKSIEQLTNVKYLYSVLHDQVLLGTMTSFVHLLFQRAVTHIIDIVIF